jgi:hypothetical protein
VLLSEMLFGVTVSTALAAGAAGAAGLAEVLEGALETPAQPVRKTAAMQKAINDTKSGPRFSHEELMGQVPFFL